MPTQTFFRLPEQKKKKILQAAYKEYSRVPASEACIKNIVLEAGIPRGSFYAYFDGKDDLFRFLVIEFRNRMNKKIQAIFEENNGDLFDSCIAFHHMLLRHLEDKEKKYLRMIFSNLRSGVDHDFVENENQNKHHEQFIEYLQTLVRTDNLHLTSPSDLIDILELTVMLTRNSISKALQLKMEYPLACEKFEAKMRILWRGIEKPTS